MNLKDNEKVEVQNLLKLIRRAKFDDFQGLEALALSRAYTWLENVLKENSVPQVVKTTPKVVEPPKEPEKPISLADESKKRKEKKKPE